MSGFSRVAGGRKIGDIFPHAGKTAPANALVCNGDLIAKTAYPKLYSVIGSRHDETDDPNYYLVYPDYFRVPGKVPLSQMASHDSTLGSVEVCSSGGTTATYGDYANQGLFSNLRLQLLNTETYTHASLETCPITSADNKVFIPFTIVINNPGAGSEFYLKVGVSRRTPASGHGFSYSGSTLLDGASYVRMVVNAYSSVGVYDLRYRSNGDMGGSYSDTPIIYQLPSNFGEYGGYGYTPTPLSFGLMIDYTAGTIALKYRDTIYPMGTYDKAARTVYPYIGIETSNAASAKEINVAYMRTNAVKGGGLPGTPYRTDTPMPAGYINPFDRPNWNTGKIEESSAKYPGVWWADVQEPGLKNDTVLWCIQAK